MKTNEMVKNAGYTFEGIAEREVSFVTDNSAKVTEGCVFVCIKGKNFDGHSVALDAEKNGAVLIVAERDTGAANQLIVPDSREAYALLCAAFFGNPASKLRLIGVTGTNGKTTTCFLLKSIFEQLGHKTGLIGTVKNMIGDVEFEANLTTPDPFELQKLFSMMAEAECEFCVMEVSSQALAQSRVAGCHFEKAVFTNLTQDHLDYHGSFENYIAAKHILFENCDTAIVNADDPANKKMTENTSCKVVKFSVKTDAADFTAKDVRYKSNGVDYVIVGRSIISRVHIKIPGGFSVYNSMGAILTAVEVGMNFDKVVGVLANADGVPGRIEVVPTDTDYTVIIDYAHSPDGLQNILASLREIAEGRIITVFGCGGNRDKTKRPKMGRIAADMSDFAVVTSDNPRNEDPDEIVKEVLEGMKEAKIPVVSITDRTAAIEFALNEANEKDIVLLAGKGHETYQILKSGKIHYDEREVVASILERQGGKA